MELSIAGERCRIATAGPVPPLPVSDTFRSPDLATSLPVLLLHGAANDSDAWRGVMQQLGAEGIPVLAPDLPGHGLSTGSPLGSVEALAGWVIALLDALGIEQVVLAGHSMGSLIALETAVRYPQRVARLALLGTTAPMAVSESLLQAATSRPDEACRLIMKFSHTPRFMLRGSAGHGAWGPGGTLAIMRRNHPGVLASDLANCNQYSNGLAAAGAVTCPTLLISARRDRMTPVRSSAALQAALGNVRRVEIADCGHAMMAEKPREVVQALVGFIGSPVQP